MDWNLLSNVSASSQNQQCLRNPGSATVSNVQSQSGGVPQNHYIPSGPYMPSKNNQLLQNLLVAKTKQETLKANQAALARRIQPKPSTNQVPVSQYSSPYKSVHETVSKQDAFNVQNPLASNYRMPQYFQQNTIKQMALPQQQPMQATHQFNASVLQQPVQNSQVLQNCQLNVNFPYPQQNMLQVTQNAYNTTRPASNAVHNACSQMAPKGTSTAVYDLQNSGSGQYISSQKSAMEANVSSSMQVYRNSQNVTNAAMTNYRLTHFNTVPQQLPTVPQIDGSTNYYVQSPQRQVLPNGFVNNSPQMLTTSAPNVQMTPAPNVQMTPAPNVQMTPAPNVQMTPAPNVQMTPAPNVQMTPAPNVQMTPAPNVQIPTSYAQAAGTRPQLFNVSSQNFTNQNYVVPNGPLPAQTSTTFPVPSSATGDQAEINRIIVSQDRKRELLLLLQVYQNVKRKYEMLNKENNQLRERLQANASLENVNPPPLISSLPTPPANARVGDQQTISQDLPVQNPSQIGHDNGFQSQNVYENRINASTEQSLQGGSSPPENPGLPNQCKSEGKSQCRQNNYSVFDGGQTSVGNSLSSPLPLVGNETLPTKINQELTPSSPMVASNTNNTYVPSSIQSKNNLSNYALGIQSFIKSTPESSTVPEKPSNEFLPFCTPGNGPLTAVSREAIEASLPLWKIAPQNSTSNTGSLEPQHKMPIIDLTDDAFKLPDTVTFANEVTSVVPAHKTDSASLGQANPQIAIVSPLVQTKEALPAARGLPEDYQLPKAYVQSPEAESATISSLTNTRESECLQKILEVLESIEANTMNNSKTSKSKEQQVDSPTLLPSSTEPSDQLQLAQKSSQDIEIIDDNLQISGICTLVEGNSLYDSSVAMMFEKPLKTEPDEVTENIADQPQTLNMSCITDPKADSVAIKTEPLDDDSALHVNEDAASCPPLLNLELQQSAVSYSELKSGDVSDQLSELLTEFPYGLKNYISEIKLDYVDEQYGTFSEKPVSCMEYVPAKIFDQVQIHGSSCIGLKSETVHKPYSDFVLEPEKPLLDHEPVDEKPPKDLPITKSVPPTDLQLTSQSTSPLDVQISIPPTDLKLTNKSVPPLDVNMSISPTDLQLTSKSVPPLGVNMFVPPTDLQLTSKSVAVPPLDVNRSVSPSNTASDDYYEISDSPASDIHITLLGQDDIAKFFPDEYDKPESNISSNIKVEPEDEDEVLHTENNPELHSPEKSSTNDKHDDVPDQTAFCCLFSWLTYTNGNAPKCNCKTLESSEQNEDEKHESDACSLLTHSSPQSPEHKMITSSKPKVSALKNEPMHPTEKPPKLDPIVPNAEILQPMDKPPTLELAISSAENVKKMSHSFSTKGEGSSSRPTYSPKELIGQNIDHKKKNLSISLNIDHTNRDHKDGSISRKKRKSDGSQKSEKLIVNTDFLKSKHPHKDRKEDIHASQWPEGDKNRLQHGFSKRSEESRQEGGERVAYKSVAEKSEHHSPVKPSEKSLNMSKPFYSVEKSRRGRKRKEHESHFEKTRKVLSVQEYLERKRELCNKRSENRKAPNEGVNNMMQMLAERPSPDSSKSDNLQRPLSFASNMINVQPKSPRDVDQRSNKSRGPHETGHRKHKHSHSSHRQESKNKTQTSSFNKGKIYLTPCVGPKRRPDEQISLTKLQIRPSPEKSKDPESRKSLESYSHTTLSNFTNKDPSPKMLEFKLYPEFTHANPTTQNQSQEDKDRQARSTVEAIKSNKEAWCNAIPLKKRRVESCDGQGTSASPASAKSYKPLDKSLSRSTQDSKSTFNLFKQMYHEQRSKSLDASLGSASLSSKDN